MDEATDPQANAAPAAPAAEEQILQRRRDAKIRLSRERTKNINRALVCSAIFAVLLTFGIYTGLVPLPTSSVGPREVSIDWAADRFAATRTGQIVVPGRDGVSCQQVLFNNETGLLSSSKPVRCNDAAPVNSNTESKSNPESRRPGGILGSLRDGFVKK